MMQRCTLFFMGLNGVRSLSIISLILVFASTILVMVTNVKAFNAFQDNKGNSTMEDCDYIEGSTVPNQPAGIFWAVVASLLVIFQTIILLLSEVSWPSQFFEVYFPVLSRDFGLGPLGIFQALISTQILSHHVDDFTLVSAFFLFAIGCVNMLLGLIFRESAKEKRSITAWRAEGKGVLPSHSDNRPVFVNSSPTFVRRHFTSAGNNNTSRSSDRPDSAEFGTWKSGYSEKTGYGFGHHGEKAAGLRGFVLQKPEESLPRYMTPPPPASREHSVHTHSRTPSVASSSSSFASPYRESRSDGEKPPVFKSSPTAL